MAYDFSEYNQLLAEKYEQLMESGERVVLYNDFIPYGQFSMTMGLISQEMQKHFSMDFEDVKQEMINTVESFWVKETNCIIIRFFLWNNPLFVELPKSHFIWSSEDSLPFDSWSVPSRYIC